MVGLSLAEKVGLDHTALIVVDVQNDFCAPNGFMDKEGEDLSSIQPMVDRLQDLLAVARGAGARIIFIQSIYGTDPNWYLSPAWLDRAQRSLRGGHTEYKVCGLGEWGSQFYGVEPDLTRSEIVVNKHRYSAFLNTPLETILRSSGIRTVVLTGVASNVCVESTARDGFMRDFLVVLVEDCCAAYREEEQRSAVWNVSKYFGQVVNSRELSEIWASAGDAQPPRVLRSPA